ncbi:MAG: hormogonium polysaccharide biosynthesis glycosyltransferase HpsE [Xenococcaceae cyanobacterium]
MVDFTVAICTYNGEKRLPDVLDRVRSQIDTENISWEIIVVDNNSQDDTAKVVQEYQEDWDKPYPLTYCFEQRQGAAFARKKAIKEANSPLIGFLDDDNLPNSYWVASAYNFAEKHPQAGAFASLIQGDFEVEPPPNFNRIKAFLAITERGNKARLYNPKFKLLPPSAGLVVRKQAWLQSVPEKCILSGRIPGSMLTGEDTEVLGYFQQKSWEIWYNPEMKIIHKIPANRLTKDYLIPFMRGIGLSRYVTRMIGVKSWQKPFLSLAYFMHDLRKIVLHFLKYGRAIKTDLVTACEFELYVNSLISPLYLWSKGYFK